MLVTSVIVCYSFFLLFKNVSSTYKQLKDIIFSSILMRKTIFLFFLCFVLSCTPGSTHSIRALIRCSQRTSLMAAQPPVSNRLTSINNVIPILVINETPMPPSAPANGPLPPATQANGLNSRELTFNLDAQSNPYFLHANENPTLVLVSTPMDGSNYHPRARDMTMALSCKNKLAFINGAITKPALDDRKYQVWERCNDTSFDHYHQQSATVFFGLTVYGIWNYLKRRFSQQDLF